MTKTSFGSEEWDGQLLFNLSLVVRGRAKASLLNPDTREQGNGSKRGSRRAAMPCERGGALARLCVRACHFDPARQGSGAAAGPALCSRLADRSVAGRDGPAGFAHDLPGPAADDRVGQPRLLDRPPSRPTFNGCSLSDCRTWGASGVAASSINCGVPIDITPKGKRNRQLAFASCPTPSEASDVADNLAGPIAILSPFRHAAVQRMLGVMKMDLPHDAESRSTPARVYPAFKGAEDWIVEPPVDGFSAIVEPKTFTGRSALLKALEYAHCNYTNVLYLSR